MPELSQREREKVAEIDAEVAAVRLVDLLEWRVDLLLRCLVCGKSRTWHRDTMLGARRNLLGSTLRDIQKRIPCSCRARPVQLLPLGWRAPSQTLPEVLRSEVIKALLDAGLKPWEYGYGPSSDLK
jgi:hypothetical protein